MTDLCPWCDKEVTASEKRNKKANFLLSKWSHKKCDDTYFEKQEKTISYPQNKLI